MMLKAETEKGKHTRIEMSGKFSEVCEESGNIVAGIVQALLMHLPSEKRFTAADYFKAAIVAGFKTGLTEFKKHEENAHETVD